MARKRERRHFDVLSLLSFARVLARSVGAVASEEIEAALRRALQLAHDVGAKVLEPMAHAELAALARLTGDEDARQRELAEAHRGFVEVGATDRAAGVAIELAISAG